jgi:hypothetical protein
MAFLPSSIVYNPAALEYGCDYGDLGAAKKSAKKKKSPAKFKTGKPAAFGKKGAATAGQRGISIKRVRPGVSETRRKDILKKHKFLRDEDRDLESALASRDSQRATKVFARLARLRDAGYRKAASALKGKRLGQISGRTTVAVATAGTSELVRLIPGVKKGVAKRRAKAAEPFKAQGKAADDLFRYWRAKFAKAHKAKMVVMPVSQMKKIDALEVEGATEGTAPEAGESVSAAESQMEAEAGPEAAAAQDEGVAPGDTGEEPTPEETASVSEEAAVATKDETGVEAAPAESEGGNKTLMYGLGAVALLGVGWYAYKKSQGR